MNKLLLLATTTVLTFVSSQCFSAPRTQEMVLETTAYIETEDGGITCFGKPIVAGRTLAVDPRYIPYGSKVFFHSTGETYTAEDCGGAIKGYKADKAMKTYDACMKYGRRMERVTVYFPE